MFGGIALISGHMACQIVGDDLVVRLAKKATESALAEPYVRPMSHRGRGPPRLRAAGSAALGALLRTIEEMGVDTRTGPLAVPSRTCGMLSVLETDNESRTRAFRWYGRYFGLRHKSATPEWKRQQAKRAGI